MDENLLPVTRQVSELASIEVTEEMLRSLDFNSFLPKIKEVGEAYKRSGDSIDELLKKGKIKIAMGSWSGANDRTLASAERALVEGAKVTIGLSLLSILYAKVIKHQQDKLADQQNTLADQQTKLEKQQNDILALQGVTAEQAARIHELLTTGEYVQKRIDQLRNELNDKLNDQNKTIDKKLIEARQESENLSKRLVKEQTLELTNRVDELQKSANLGLSNLSERMESHRGVLNQLKLRSSQWAIFLSGIVLVCLTVLLSHLYFGLSVSP